MGFFDGLFGDNGAGKLRGQQQGFQSQQAGVASQFGDDAARQAGRYNTFQPQADEAAQGYANYLKTDPFTDQNSTAALNQATAGTTDAYNRAGANLTASLARRGIDADSSMAAGGLTSLAAAQAGTVAGAQNQLAYNKINDAERRQTSLLGLLSGEAGQAHGMQQADLGQQEGIDQNLAGQYGQEATNAENQQGGLLSLLGAAGSALGGAAGAGTFGSMFKRRAPGVSAGQASFNQNPAAASGMATAQGWGF